MAGSKTYIPPPRPSQPKPPTAQEAFVWQETRNILDLTRNLEVRVMLHISNLSPEEKDMIHQASVRIYSITEANNEDS